ncbi:hypothetical protein B0A55_07399 [Friedmanniomyces simplex]|uniref:SGNH hydrolase-type esterase domain-containing protein n=1 Tax=Friedmanniomyces simplex TaxID=329884 RepID=A0A4U0XAP7_9PEZI|nr:hypothetical protein B0A55_07399 [Friedmanniomyces simplex]
MGPTNLASLRWLALLGIGLLRVPPISAQQPSWCSTTSFQDGDSNQTGSHFRILPMGASIVYGLESSDGNGFRLGLQNLLEANGTQVTMVGTQWSGNMSDNHHEAYLAVTIDDFTNKSDHSGAYGLEANVILVLIGTNDCWYVQNQNSTAADPRVGDGIAAASRFGDSLLGSIWAHAPGALVLSSTLPRNTNQWEDRCIQGFNSHLPAVVHDAVARGQQVRLVDMYDVVPVDQIQADGTHPTDEG